MSVSSLIVRIIETWFNLVLLTPMIRTSTRSLTNESMAYRSRNRPTSVHGISVSIICTSGAISKQLHHERFLYTFPTAATRILVVVVVDVVVVEIGGR